MSMISASHVSTRTRKVCFKQMVVVSLQKILNMLPRRQVKFTLIFKFKSCHAPALNALVFPSGASVSVLISCNSCIRVPTETHTAPWYNSYTHSLKKETERKWRKTNLEVFRVAWKTVCPAIDGL